MIGSWEDSFSGPAGMGVLDLSPGRQELLLRIGVLTLIYILAFFVRLFSVLRYESVIHEVGKVEGLEY